MIVVMVWLVVVAGAHLSVCCCRFSRREFGVSSRSRVRGTLVSPARNSGLQVVLAFVTARSVA